MTLDILVVAYCGWDALAETLASIARWSEPGYRLTVFENGTRNYPLTALWNRFMASSRRDVVALCNPDILVGPGWDAECLACFEANPECAVVSPLSNTAPHRAALQSIVPDALDRSGVEALAARVAVESHERFHWTREPDMAPGHAVLVRRAAWAQLGGFDERLPFGGNDFEFNRRVIAHNLSLAVATRAFTFHRWGVSTEDARRLGQFDEARHEPRFRTIPGGLTFDEL